MVELQICVKNASKFSVRSGLSLLNRALDDFAAARAGRRDKASRGITRAKILQL